MTHLYGASCQGIQSFIFETDKLKEIVGGSELVELLFTSKFEEFLQEVEIQGQSDCTKIVSAAGNIRYIFTDDVVKRVVLEFPKYVSSLAPGITISQAVQPIAGHLSKGDMDKLEEKLKAQRNKARRPADLGFLAVERCRRTARPAVGWVEDEPIDEGLIKKQKAGGENAPKTLLEKLVPSAPNLTNNIIPFEMEEMIDPQKSEWLAVIHADGNNLGMMIQAMADKLAGSYGDKIAEVFQQFSTNLEKATIAAAQDACAHVISVQDYITKNNKLPIRPIIIGGDDLTVIIRADLALDFTRAFLNKFQEHTKVKLADLVNTFELTQFASGLTACAGIAFVKPKYPFHYAADLAEELCGAAKKASKDISKKNGLENVLASLAFFKVRSSFLDSYKDLCKRELMAGEVNLNYGPYYVPVKDLGKDDKDDKYGMPNLLQLQENLELLRKDDAPVSSLRKWISALGRDKEEAKQLMQRIQQITKDEYWQGLKLADAIKNDKTPVITSVTTPVTTPMTTPVADWLTINSLSKGGAA